jgi:hypothetical protein
MFSVLAAVAAGIAVAQGLTDVAELALYASPFLLLAGLLLSGRFVGEQTILRRRAAAPVTRMQRERARWPRRAALAPAFVPVHDPRVERGPPSLATAAV